MAVQDVDCIFKNLYFAFFTKVTLFFHGKLYRGNRALKVDARRFGAFDSPNCPPLATVEAGIEGMLNIVQSNLLKTATQNIRTSGHLLQELLNIVLLNSDLGLYLPKRFFKLVAYFQRGLLSEGVLHFIMSWASQKQCKTVRKSTIAG